MGEYTVQELLDDHVPTQASYRTYLKLSELLHELLLLFAVAQRRNDVEEDLQQV